METFGGILAAIVIAILITAIFYYGFNARGPWGSLWTFFLVLLLIIWAASLWARPVGPVYWGVAWIPLFFVGLLVALLLAAIPTNDPGTYETLPEEEVEIDETELAGRRVDRTEIEGRRERMESHRATTAAAVAISWVFWVFIIIITVVIILGIIGYAA